jgi:hypothetical protein
MMPHGGHRSTPRVIAALAGPFVIESVLPTTITAAIKTITEAVFIATSAIAGPRSLPTVNGRDSPKFDMPLCLAARRVAVNYSSVYA